jgi:hypothetical protein
MNDRGYDRFGFLTLMCRKSGYSPRLNSGKTVLAQILAGWSGEEFSHCAKRYPMARDTPALSAYDRFATMVGTPCLRREICRFSEVPFRHISFSRRKMSWRYKRGIRAFLLVSARRNCQINTGDGEFRVRLSHIIRCRRGLPQLRA